MEIDEAEPQNHPTQYDFGGVSGTWCLAYLIMPDRDEARRATVVNMLTTAEGLPNDWEAKAQRLEAYLMGADSIQQTPPPRGLKSRLVVNNDKPAA